MKKLFLFALAAFLLTAVSCSDDDNKEKIIDAAQLPETAKMFAEAHLPEATFTRVEHQSVPDSDGSVYDTKLSNGFEIDFDSDGNWTDIDGNNQTVPDAIVPQPILDYVAANYASSTVTTIEIENHGYDIELSNGTDLVFNENGEFIRIDR